MRQTVKVWTVSVSEVGSLEAKVEGAVRSGIGTIQQCGMQVVAGQVVWWAVFAYPE